MRLALVRSRAQILERDCRLDERVLVLGRATEVEGRSRDGSGTECVLQRGHVCPLDRPENACCLTCERRAESLAALGFRVEGRLQVLEREGVVEDRDVGRRGRFARLRQNERCKCSAASCEGAEQEVPPRLSGDTRRRLAERAVAIDCIDVGLQADQLLTNPVRSTSASTSRRDLASSVGWLAGCLSWIALIHAACLALTETMRAAACRAGFERLVA